ncbi:hypothetical protein PT286_09845 [Neisseriaceae bacterium ESL0693]|nr:hypothetical protein [Neisseriaceae bacterium ESL0693]
MASIIAIVQCAANGLAEVAQKIILILGGMIPGIGLPVQCVVAKAKPFK